MAFHSPCHHAADHLQLPVQQQHLLNINNSCPHGTCCKLDIKIRTATAKYAFWTHRALLKTNKNLQVKKECYADMSNITDFKYSCTCWRMITILSGMKIRIKWKHNSSISSIHLQCIWSDNENLTTFLYLYSEMLSMQHVVISKIKKK